MRVAGLMSGTSADGIDAALVEWPDGPEARPFELIAYLERPHPESLQAAIHRLAAGELPADRILAEQIRLDRVLADAFADSALALFEAAGADSGSIAGVASHGQTVAHRPEHGGSLQIGCPARLAERLGRPVIADFRRRDLAMGGEGAPLAPFFHHAVFSDAAENRGVLNLGGIANLTWLPAGGAAEGVMAFDVGPANSLLDGVITQATDERERFDRDGACARAGKVVEGWLTELLDDPYLRRPPPKSTGREQYGLAQARGWLARAEREGVALDDLLATLTAFGVRAIEAAWRGLPVASDAGSSARLFVGGGGARNGFMMESLARAIPGAVVEPMDAGGVPADAAEAMAFSLMGRNTLLGIPNQLPQCTGVAEARVLGVLHGAEWR
ncbi:MAG: anhydro-N-acetylmuramic acid kinase [Deltaproteobacteria bacterium]|nr:anhydro-N-acetylmuramic acid kinase [Deltaproteobacteria bacterium]